MNAQRDPDIVHEANALRSFRIHLSIYVIINGILWLIWLFNGGMSVHAWPAYPSVIWGIGLLAHYISAYRASRPNNDKN